MKLRIEIDMNNAAFEECSAYELRDIFDEMLKNLTYCGEICILDKTNVYDSNGNKCGFFEVLEG